MPVRAAPSLISSLVAMSSAVSASCEEIVVYDDWSATPIQVLDYYPYGSARISDTTARFNEGKQFIAEYTDPNPTPRCEFLK
jgi:hypothetical protein